MIYIDTCFDTIDVEHAADLLPPQRRQKVGVLKNVRDRQLSIAVWRLLGRALENEFGLTEVPPFVIGPHGKPSLEGHPDIFFNLSHCRRAAVCATGRRPLGVDAETIRPFKDDLARYVLNDAEYAAVTASADPSLAFTRLWTMKESLVKLRGTGLTDDLKTLLDRQKAGVAFTTWTWSGFVVTQCEERL